MRYAMVWIGVVAVAANLLSGCRAETSKDAGGNNKVQVATPFGGMQIRTNDSAESGIGMAVYPGATLARKEHGDDDSNNASADINLSLGNLRMRMKVLSYRTTDAPEQVQSFYRKQLARYGTVIACVNDMPSGEPTRTPEGLSCDKSKDRDSSTSDRSSGELELKAGSRQHQHVISIQKEGNGTRFAMVALDLPKHFSLGDNDSKSDKESE